MMNRQIKDWQVAFIGNDVFNTKTERKRYARKMMNKLIKRIKRLWKEYIIDDYPYDDEM